MSYEKLLPAQSQGIEICSISFNMMDRIRLMGLSLDVINSMRNAISNSWGEIQNEKDYHGSYEFKLSGNPWLGSGEEAVTSRRLLQAILTTMAQYGWNLLQAADISKKPGDKDTLFFEKGTPDPDAHLFAMSFNMTDKLRIIGAPSMVPCVQSALQIQWPNGIQKIRDYNGADEIKLAGNPWFSDGTDTVQARMLLCQIIANVRGTGYKLYASVDISTDNKGHDSDSWIFRKISDAWQ